VRVPALSSLWSASSSAQRAGAAAVVAAIALAVCAGFLVVHPARTAVFAQPLHPEQLSEVEERLAAWNVPFTPVADNVLVEAGRRNAVLLRLSLAGVPHEHVESSSDVLGKLGALTPQSVVDAQARDGLAGDIELGLRGIDGITDARVIIAPAKPAYFADESSQDASASVRLQLAAGARLSSDAVNGIRAFVAASVPGLRAERVTIVDDRGIALGDTDAQGDSGDLQRSLQTALDASLGEGATIVRVHVDYDRRSISSRDVRRAPVQAAAIGVATQNEHYSSNVKRYDRTEQQIDRGSETREIAATVPAGRISRISGAVFVDAARGIDLALVRELASATLGIDARRGDTLDVAALGFAREPVAKKDGWWLAYGAIVPLLPALAAILALGYAARAAVPPLTQALSALGDRARIARTTESVTGVPPSAVRDRLEREPPHTAAAIISALPAATAAAVLDMYPEAERSAIVRRMQRPASPLLADMENFIGRA
jgi:flagellar M-ring protein FliF